MDLKKSKPVHLNCPNCGHDFSVNTNKIEEDYANARIKTASLEKEITRMKNSGISRKSPAFKRVIEQHKDAQAQCAAIKAARKALSDESELQKYQIFKELVKGIIGKEKQLNYFKRLKMIWFSMTMTQQFRSLTDLGVCRLREGKCVVCGRSFMYDRGNKITCSEECAIIRNRTRSAEYKAEQRKKPRVPRKKKVKSNLNKDLKAARKLGMSYGKYMAVMHGGMAVERGEGDGKID